MIVTDITDPQLVATLITPSPGRSKGVHLSDITSNLWKLLNPEKFGGPMHPELIGLGVAWEQFLEHHIFAGQGERPGEFLLDGVSMSPDWIGDELEEWKLTFMGMPATPQAFGTEPKFARYHMQAKSYCRVLGTDTMLFRVLWVAGDYRAIRLPTWRHYLCVYTAIELDENWDMLRQHGKDVNLL